MTTENTLSNAIELIKAGKKDEAQKLLKPYLEANPHDINAWLWEAETWSSPEKKIEVLEMCLVHNPDNQQIRRALAAKQSKWSIDFSLNSWGGRLFLTLATVQMAIFCASLMLTDPPSIMGAMVMAFSHPLSLWYFSWGLTYTISQYFFQGNQFEKSLLLAWLIYLSILIPAILIKKRVVFFVLYVILVLILITNVTGCTIMPKLGPGRAM
jgi:hypothetical protein